MKSSGACRAYAELRLVSADFFFTAEGERNKTGASPTDNRVWYVGIPAVGGLLVILSAVCIIGECSICS